MHRLDPLVIGLHRWARSQPFLYRFTLGTRILLAAGFIPTGLVKLLGRRFTIMSPETTVGAFFEALYQSGPYWNFIGLAQVTAGVLVLVPATATLGAVLFFPIILNIFVITVSLGFQGTPVVTGLMLLANLYLLAWDYHRLRGVFTASPYPDAAALPQHRLSGTAERLAYGVGAVAGIGFFLGTRSLLPGGMSFGLLGIAALSMLVAAWFAVVRRGVPAPRPAIEIAG